jgi:hypothetical protein
MYIHAVKLLIQNVGMLLGCRFIFDNELLYNNEALFCKRKLTLPCHSEQNL